MFLCDHMPAEYVSFRDRALFKRDIVWVRRVHLGQGLYEGNEFPRRLKYGNDGLDFDQATRVLNLPFETHMKISNYMADLNPPNRLRTNFF